MKKLIFPLYLLVFLFALFLLFYSFYKAYLFMFVPVSENDLLLAKSECSTISDFIPSDQVIIPFSLFFALDECKRSQLVLKQRAILK